MARKVEPKRRPKNQRRRARRAVPPKVAALKKPKRTRKGPRSDPLIETAVLEMNRGRSLTAAARSLRLSPKSLQQTLKQRGLAKRKGQRWVTKDNRLRRVPVMTGGDVENLIVRGYESARFVGEHHHAAGEFVRTNDIKLIKPFEGRTVRAANGRRYILETDPNALHRIAAMDSPPFHEIYEILSPT